MSTVTPLLFAGSSYRYDELLERDGSIRVHGRLFHLTPRDGARQHCLRHEIRIEPVPAARSEFIDAFGNRVAHEHVALAWARDFGDVSPLRGVILGGGSHSRSVNVAVRIASD